MDDLKRKLEARTYSIKANIIFANNYLKGGILNNVEKEEEIEKLLKQQEEYKKDVERLIESFVEYHEKKAVDQVKERLSGEADFLLNEKADMLNSVLKKLYQWSNQSELLVDLDIKIDQAFADCSKISEKISNDHNKIIIIIIGRRGAGKTTFVNSFMNCNNYDDNACETGATEITSEPKLVDYYNENKLESFGNQNMSLKLWDFPGVGTDKFPMGEYKLLIEYLPVDAYIYLYKGRFQEPDEEIIQSLKEKKKKLFIVRSSVDVDLNAELENSGEGVDINEIDIEDIKQYFSRYSSVLNKKYETEIGTINKCLETEDTRVYHISGKNDFKSLFDYNKLIESLIESIPKHKAHVLLHAFKKNTTISFYLKYKMIGEIIKIWSIESVKILTNEEEFVIFIKQKTKEITSMYGIEIGTSRMLSTSESNRNLELIQSNSSNETASVTAALINMPSFSKADVKRAEKFKVIVIFVHDALNKINQTCLARVAGDVLTIETSE